MADPDKKTEEQTPFFERETTWKQIVLGTAGLFAVLLIIGVLALIGYGADEYEANTQILWRFAVIGGALVTFATVMWRGIIATRQADTQLGQLSSAQAQIRQNEETNLAALLQKGAELLDGAERPASRDVGIASLASVAESGSERYAASAMDILAGYIERHSSYGHHDRQVGLAIGALNQAHIKTGVRSRLSIDLQTRQLLAKPLPPDPNASRLWRPVLGVTGAVYVGGGILFDFDLGRQASQNPHLQFQNVTVWGAEDLRLRANQFIGCRFIECAIAELDQDAMTANEFLLCAFSGAHLLLSDHPSTYDTVGDRNFADVDNPPLWLRSDANPVAVSGWDFVAMASSVPVAPVAVGISTD